MFYTNQYATITTLRKQPKQVLQQLSKGATTILVNNQPKGVLLSIEEFSRFFRYEMNNGIHNTKKKTLIF